jgi:hypothetical protein
MSKSHKTRQVSGRHSRADAGSLNIPYDAWTGTQARAFRLLVNRSVNGRT